jgi:trehalose-6-phosphatase
MLKFVSVNFIFLYIDYTGKCLTKLFSYSIGYADSSEVFPVYIGDDRTDEDAFKVCYSNNIFSN